MPLVDIASTLADDVPSVPGAVWILGSTLVTALLLWVGSFIAKKTREPIDYSTVLTQLDKLTKAVYGDPEKDEPGLLSRVAKAERRADAAGRIVKATAQQWPKNVPPPRLNPSDIEELEVDTLPPHWIRERAS
ncbi:hypothetical protein [Microbacterium stercoris]|uniref:Uncharacterized protein n=1 Tax=Microbacterium stercoris TaxID=2820289 RepID=A0A939TU81_9MICO|nr:hypothetical protein [Microbacterium stercoris]MBO3663749.1 hypothetical protein [Microbacterium stercoris]